MAAGLTAGAGEGVLFAHGRRVCAVPEDELLEALFALIADEHGGEAHD